MVKHLLKRATKEGRKKTGGREKKKELATKKQKKPTPHQTEALLSHKKNKFASDLLYFNSSHTNCHLFAETDFHTHAKYLCNSHV